MAKLALFLDPLGRPLRGATVEVFRVGTNRRATLYSDNEMSAETSNPLRTDSKGAVSAYIPAGTIVDILVDAPIYGKLWFRNTEILGTEPELFAQPGFEAPGGWSYVDGANRTNVAGAPRTGSWCADVRVTFTLPSGPWVYERIEQAVTGLLAGANYKVTGYIWDGPGDQCELRVDGTAIATLTSTVDDYEELSETFEATATAHTIAFAPVGGPGIGSTIAFIDDCSMKRVA